MYGVTLFYKICCLLLHCPIKALILENSDLWVQRQFTIILIFPTANFMPVAHIMGFFYWILLLRSLGFQRWLPKRLLQVSQSIRTVVTQELLSNLNSRDFVLFCSTLQNNKEFHPWVGSWDWTKFVCSLEKDVWNKLFTRSFILISSIINT